MMDWVIEALAKMPVCHSKSLSFLKTLLSLAWAL